MDGKTARGASSPANPALHIPDPLSTTRAATSSSSHILLLFLIYKLTHKVKTKERERERNHQVLLSWSEAIMNGS